MIKKIIAIVLIFVVLISAISLFLSPENLGHCGDRPSSLKGCEAADAIVAVSGGDTTARTQMAIDLYQRGWAPKIIFSGAAADKSGPSNARVMRTQALKQAVPKENIIIEEASETTHQNAEQTTSIFTQNNIKSAILVTSGYHQKRTILEFSSRASGVKFRSQPTASDRQWSAWWWTSPFGWYLAVSEIVKIIIFYLGASR